MTVNKNNNTLLRAFLFLSSSRPAELRGRQPPGVAHTGCGDVLLVASVSRSHHALQTQPALPDPNQQQLSLTDQIWEGGQLQANSRYQ